MSVAGWLRAVAAVTVLTLAGAAGAQVPGKDFAPLNPPQPSQTPGKIEVIEFFSYGCPHCSSLEPSLAAWLKRKPADVDFRRVPVVFSESWAPLAQLYYTLEAMGLLDKLHHEVFAALHTQKLRLQDPKVLGDWVASKGVDRQKFNDTYNSFSVKSLAKRAVDTTGRYKVEFTPAVVVDGRFMTGPSMTATGNSIDYDRFFKVVDELIAASRKKPAGGQK